MLFRRHSGLIDSALESDRAVWVRALVGALRYVLEQDTLLS